MKLKSMPSPPTGSKRVGPAHERQRSAGGWSHRPHWVHRQMASSPAVVALQNGAVSTSGWGCGGSVGSTAQASSFV